MSDFNEIVAHTAVSGWHAAWEAARLRLGRKTSTPLVTDIGEAAMAQVPADQLPDVMDALYTAYHQNRCDWDIRRTCGEQDDVGPALNQLRKAVEAARLADAKGVIVRRDELAAVLDRYEQAALHLSHCRKGQP